MSAADNSRAPVNRQVVWTQQREPQQFSEVVVTYMQNRTGCPGRKRKRILTLWQHHQKKPRRRVFPRGAVGETSTGQTHLRMNIKAAVNLDWRVVTVETYVPDEICDTRILCMCMDCITSCPHVKALCVQELSCYPWNKESSVNKPN